MIVGDRIVVLDRERNRGRHVRYAGQRGTVRKLNGSCLLVELETGEVVWVRLKSVRCIETLSTTG